MTDQDKPATTPNVPEPQQPAPPAEATPTEVPHTHDPRMPHPLHTRGLPLGDFETKVVDSREGHQERGGDD